MKCLKKFFQKRRIISKIRKHLPNFHTKTGQPLYWNVHIHRVGCEFDSKTGKTIGGRVEICVTQKCPRMCSVDNQAYGYDWKKKELYEIKDCHWE